MAHDSAHRLRLPHGRAADLASACGVFLLAAVWNAAPLIREDPTEPWPVTLLGWLLIVAACGALYFRRRYPVAVTVFTLAATAAYYLTSAYDGPLLVALIVALFSVAAGGCGRPSPSAPLSSSEWASERWLYNGDVNGVAIFMLTGWLVAVVALGTMRHGRFAFAEEEARRRATEERLRIARDLHDVIGHNISLINVQASAALHRLKKHPEQAEDALAAIKQSSREALGELRATLGVLRQVDEEAPTKPAPGLARLHELVASVKPTGLDVKVCNLGQARVLPAAVDLAAFRVVQESLTNVTRHARGATTVEVRLGFGERELSLAIEDDGDYGAVDRGAGNRNTGGSGIKGMRERVAALGGELSAGPGPGPRGGFAVTARIPYED